MSVFKVKFISSLAFLGMLISCSEITENRRTTRNNASSEIIDSDAVKGSSYLANSERAVKRFKSIESISKLMRRSLNINSEEYYYNANHRKATGTLSYFGTNASNANSKPVDSTQLGWFKTIRDFTAARCLAFINREAGNPKDTNLLIKHKNLPSAADLNDLPLKVLRLDGVDDSVHEIASTYEPAFKKLEAGFPGDPGSNEYFAEMKKAYHLYCIAVFTDPLVIYY